MYLLWSSVDGEIFVQNLKNVNSFLWILPDNSNLYVVFFLSFMPRSLPEIGQGYIPFLKFTNKINLLCYRI